MALRMLCALAAAAVGVNALADEPRGILSALEEAFRAPDWTLQVEPNLWYVAPGGKVKMPGAANSDTVRLEDLNIDRPRMSPYGKVRGKMGDWLVGISGFGFEAARTAQASAPLTLGGTTLSAGDTVRTRLEFSSFDLTGAYRIYENSLARDKDGLAAVAPSLDVLVGARVISVDYDMSFSAAPGRPALTPAGASADKLFFDPIVGFKFDMEFLEKFNINAEVKIGGMPGTHASIAWDIIAGFSYRPLPNVGIQLGYRQLAFRLSSGSGADKFRYDGALAGLYFGVLVRF